MELFKSLLYYLTIYLAAKAIYTGYQKFKSKHTKSRITDGTKLVLDPGDWYQEVTIFPVKKSLKFYGHTPDYDGIFHSTYEYRLQGEVVQIRVIEDYSEHYSKIERNVSDGVVLESEIQKRYKESKFNIVTVDEQIEKFRAQVLWHELARYDIKIFILLAHPQDISQQDVRRFARREAERIRIGTEKVLDEARKLGLETNVTTNGFEFLYPDNYPDEERKIAESLFHPENLRIYGVTSNEIGNATKIISDLESFLGQIKAA